MIPSVFAATTSQRWPSAPGEPARRIAERRFAMRQVLERFVNGSSLVPRQDLKELGSDPIQMAMKGYWAIRSQGPMEETRLLGFFARPGAFLATAFVPRGKLTANWQNQHIQCLLVWNTIFPADGFLDHPWPVLTRADYEEYTNAND